MGSEDNRGELFYPVPGRTGLRVAPTDPILEATAPDRKEAEIPRGRTCLPYDHNIVCITNCGNSLWSVGRRMARPDVVGLFLCLSNLCPSKFLSIPKSPLRLNLLDKPLALVAVRYHLQRESGHVMAPKRRGVRLLITASFNCSHNDSTVTEPAQNTELEERAAEAASEETLKYAKAMYWSHEVRLNAEDPWDWDDMPEAVQERFIEKAKTYVEGKSDT